MPTLKQAGSPRKPRNLKEANLILQAYDTHQTNALTLQKIIFQEQHILIPHNRIHEVLRMANRAQPQPAKQTRRKWVRYERTHSMTLWHMAWKQLITGEWFLAIMDDASRFIVAYGVYRQATTENTLTILKQAIVKYGCPEEILTDRGTQFYANDGDRKESGISQFEQYLANAGIKHILCRVNHPQTNGKLERFYGVLEEKWRRGQLRTIPEYVH